MSREREKTRAPRTRTKKGGREHGSMDWVKKRPIPVVSILIADPERSSRAAATRVIQGLRGMRVIGEALTGHEAVTATARLAMLPPAASHRRPPGESPSEHSKKMAFSSTGRPPTSTQAPPRWRPPSRGPAGSIPGRAAPSALTLARLLA